MRKISFNVLSLEPIDEEKAAMAEAVICLSDTVEQLKAEIELLKGGTTNA